jgi:hypothetical protein
MMGGGFGGAGGYGAGAGAGGFGASAGTGFGGSVAADTRTPREKYATQLE